jgi:replicative DNA helicase
MNPAACAAIASGDLADLSSVNPGNTVYAKEIDAPIYRGMNRIAGSLRVTMKKGKMPARIVNLRIRVFSTRMRARQWVMRIQLAKKGFSVKQIQDEFLY